MAIKPTVDKIGDSALTDSIIDRSITELQDEVMMTLQPYALASCSSLKKGVFGGVTEVLNDCFSECEELETLDFYAPVEFDASALQGLPNLKTLILRSNTMCDASSGALLSYTPIGEGTGYIYVPAALVDSYKHDFIWGSYADQIRAIEDYPGVLSDAGKVWETATTSYTGGVAVSYGNGMWLVNSANRYSYDGKNWVKPDGIPNFGSAARSACADGRWVIVSSANIYWSDNGLSWTKCDLTAASTLSALSYAGGLWFASGSSSVNGLYYSSDGINFQQSGIENGYYTCVRYANGLWVMSGSYTTPGLFYSTDGNTWAKSNITSGRMATVSYNNGVWVAGTSEGKNNYYSTNGTAWTLCSGLSSTVRKFAYNGDTWVAAAGNGLYYSADGAAWTKSNASSNSFNFVEYGNGLFVAGNSSTGLYYSSDGITWEQSNMTDLDADGCAFADGMWVVVGGDGIYYSE